MLFGDAETLGVGVPFWAPARGAPANNAATTSVAAGGGAILRKDNLVVGVTTAATLWYVTMVGLCFGGGQMLLGWAATAVGFLVLNALKRVEDHTVSEQDARLSVVVSNQGARRIRDSSASRRGRNSNTRRELRSDRTLAHL
jgi:uncharacterized membrane protein YhiD involved in acid resistance